MTELETPWDDAGTTPDNYQPDVCPPEMAEHWTNTRNPGTADYANWEWDLLVDLSYIADTNPSTIQENVKLLLKVLKREERETLKRDMEEELR